MAVLSPGPPELGKCHNRSGDQGCADEIGEVAEIRNAFKHAQRRDSGQLQRPTSTEVPRGKKFF